MGLTINLGDELVIDKITFKNIGTITNDGTITVVGGNNVPGGVGQLYNGEPSITLNQGS